MALPDWMKDHITTSPASIEKLESRVKELELEVLRLESLVTMYDQRERSGKETINSECPSVIVRTLCHCDLCLR